MELYHFTSPDRADAIAAQGIEPRNECRGDCATISLTGLLYWPRDCVRLTRNGGEIPTVWGSFDKCRRVVIVRIPAADKRLISFLRWVREQMPQELAERTARSLDNEGPNTDWRSWWLYFGTILPNRIRAVVNVNLVHAETGEAL